MKLSWNVSTKVFAVALLGMIVAATISFTSYYRLKDIESVLSEVLTIGTALKNHQDCDMMHDALRADFLAALNAGQSKDPALAEEVRKDFKDHISIFQENLEANQKLQGRRI